MLFRLMPNALKNVLKARRDALRIRERHLQSIAYLKRAASAVSERCMADISTLEDWQRQRPDLRQQVLSMLGLDPLPERSPLNIRVTGVLEFPAYRVEKIVFESLPGLYVTGNLYLPKGVNGSKPCILYLCGHMPHPHGAKTLYQDRYLWYPANGFVCLALDPLEYGEVPGIHHGTHNLNMWHWLSLGYTPAGVEVWNAMRAIDWLTTRPELDAERIGVTGISGGGVMSWYLSALDERVRAAVPSCSTYTIGSQAADWLVGGQCDCTFYPNIYGLDFPVIGALIAPRPLLITGGKKDPLFPPAGYHEVYRRVKRIYDLYGPSPDGDYRIREVDADVGHEDPPLFLQEARHWMRRWLNDDPTPVHSTDNASVFSIEPPKSLACANGIPLDTVNFSIHDRFIQVAVPAIPDSALGWVQRRKIVLDGLCNQVFRWFPKGPIPFATRTLDNTGDFLPVFSLFNERIFETEPGVTVRVLIFKPTEPVAMKRLLIVVKGAGDNVYFPDTDEILPLLGTTCVIVLNLRFTDRSLSAHEFADIERTAAITGRTVAALQIWDVMRTVSWAIEDEGLSSDDISVYGHGEAGIVALYAALFEERVGHVILRKPPVSHWDKPALLTVLRITDIPEVAGILAPRRLTILRDIPAPFELTRQIYKVFGAEASIGRADSLTGAVLKRRGKAEVDEWNGHAD